MHTVDKGLLASRQVERGCLGGFTRLRTPLGLVMRRLSADCDRETGCIPQCHLVLGGYVGSDRRRMLIAYHDIYPLSLSVSLYLSVPLSLRSVSTYPSIYPTPPVVHTYSSMQHTCFTRLFSLSFFLSVTKYRLFWEPRGWVV